MILQHTNSANYVEKQQLVNDAKIYASKMYL